MDGRIRSYTACRRSGILQTVSPKPAVKRNTLIKVRGLVAHLPPYAMLSIFVY